MQNGVGFTLHGSWCYFIPKSWYYFWKLLVLLMEPDKIPRISNSVHWTHLQNTHFLKGARGTGVHLSTATRERLWARTTTSVASSSGGQNGVTSGCTSGHNARPRRLSGSNHYMYENNGYRSDETLQPNYASGNYSSGNMQGKCYSVTRKVLHPSEKSM